MYLIFKCMINAYSLKFTYMLWFYSIESSINFNENLKLLIHSIYVFYIVLCFFFFFPPFLFFFLGGGCLVPFDLSVYTYSGNDIVQNWTVEGEGRNEI